MNLPPSHFTPDSAMHTLATISRQLGEQGWSVTPGFLPAALTEQLREAVLQPWQSGEFRHAGVGRGSSFEIKPAVRSDHVNWLDPYHCTEPLREYFSIMEKLRETLNRELYLGLFDYEAHMAVYPPGAAYKKHLDQFRGIGLRTITTTLYLNDTWQAEDGGQLRIYIDDDTTEKYIDVIPQGGTLVTFLSAQYLHEVLPARRERLSITGWFKLRELHGA